MSERGRVRLPSAIRKSLIQIARLKHPSPVYLVGGALRDAALGRSIADLDLCGRDARGLAAKVARQFKGTLITLDPQNGVYRIILPSSQGQTLKQIDCAEILGRDIGEDLTRRDFTVNAMALELGVTLPATLTEREFIDPRHGLSDIRRRILCVETDAPFVDDPLRLLRAFRIAAQTGMSITAPTKRMIKKHRQLIAQPAGERVQSELLALLATPDAAQRLKEMDECGLLTALFEPLESARQCAQDYYGTGGVLKHTLTVCSRLEFLLVNFAKIYPDLARSFSKWLEERASGGGVPERAVLMLAALLHDVAKPETARMIDGRLRFFEHDTIGGTRSIEMLRALKFSREHIETVSELVKHHLRPGHLASGGPVTDKAAYRLFRDLGPRAPGLLVMCWSDHASYMPEARLRRLLSASCAKAPRRDLTQLRPAEVRKTVHHLQVVSQLLRRYFDADHAPIPTRLLDGKDVMKTLKLAAGPKVGEILELLREAQAEGKVQDRLQAIAFISRLK